MSVLRSQRRAASRPDFTLEGAYVNGFGVRFASVATSLEKRAWEALSEVAWEERISRAEILEDLVVAYLRDRFPDRQIPTREEARYEQDPDEPASEPVARLLEHDELGWRQARNTGRRAVAG
jgi:hypothetical protein